MHLRKHDSSRWELRYCFWKTAVASFALGLSFVVPLWKCATGAENLLPHQCLGALLGFSVCMIVAVLSFEKGRCRVDMDKSQLLLERRGLFRRCRETYDLARVAAFFLEQHPRQSSAGRRIAVQFHDDDGVRPLHQIYLGQGERRLQDVTDQLNALLKAK